MAKASISPSGTTLREGDLRQGSVLTTEWHPNLRYAWDAGVGIGRYLAELRKGRLTATHCTSCNRTVVPPRTLCENCFKPMREWRHVQDTGVVNTFSLCYVSWDAVRVKEPFIPAVIEIDGCSPGVGILHHLGEVDPKKVKIGMRVKAVWKPARARTGAITDIRYFKPI